MISSLSATWLSHNGGGVYGRGLRAVNPAGPGGVVACAALAVIAAGCAAPTRVYEPYPVGLWYGVQAAAVGQEDNLDRIVDQDFAGMAELGFNTVLIRHAEDRDRRRLVEAARRWGLAVAVPSRKVLYYVRTGRLPRGCDSLEALVDAAWPTETERPIPMAAIGEAADAATASRVRRVAAVLGDRDDPWATFAVVSSSTRPAVTLAARPAVAADEATTGDMLLLECGSATDDPEDAPGRRWLGQYHAGLAAGLTGGLIVDGFDVTPGRWREPGEGTDSSSVRRCTAIRRVIARATTWGPKLRWLTARAVRPLGHGSDRLGVVLFGGPKRRYVMLFNKSPGEFVRRAVQLPATLGSRPVKRAVLVPSEHHVIAGEVVHLRSDRLELPVNLAPGDACLWEVF